ncbi:MAG: penicillin-binding transpeptidase domain-containing protein [Minisyncoccia bacterium]
MVNPLIKIKLENNKIKEVEKLIKNSGENIILVVGSELKLDKKFFQEVKKIESKYKKHIKIETADEKIQDLVTANGLEVYDPFFHKTEKAVIDVVPLKSEIKEESYFTRQQIKDLADNKEKQKELKNDELISSQSKQDFAEEKLPADLYQRKPLIIQHKNKTIWVIVGVIMIIGLVIGYITYFMPSVNIYLTFQRYNSDFHFTVNANTGIAAPMVNNNQIISLPGEILTSEKNITLSFPASTKTAVQQKAKGILTIYNAYSSNPQILVAGTRVMAPNGKIYLLDNRVTIPGAQIVNGNIQPSSLDVAITASGPGESYNIRPVTGWKIPGFEGGPKYDAFYGQNKNDISGGFSGIKTVPSNSDIQNATSSAIKQLQDLLNAQTSILVLPQFKLLPQAQYFKLETINVNTSTNENNEFTVFAQAKMQSLVFRESDLQQVIINTTKNDLIKNQNWSLTDRVLIKENINQSEILALSSLNLPGIDLEDNYSRSLLNNSYGHLIGYTTLVSKDDLIQNPNLNIEDRIGRLGLEQSYDYYLRGIDGKDVYNRNVVGKSQNKILSVQPQAGDSIDTFIDSDLQNFIYDDLQKTLKNLNRDKGIVIALNPQNGEVLSLVSLPVFDLNNLTTGFTDPSKPFFNRAISGLYSPGSTVKPLDALAILANNIISPDKQIYAPSYITIPNPYYPDKPSIYHDWKPHGWVDLKKAIAVSSDIYFYETVGGYQNQVGLGINKLVNWWEKFGFNNKTGIDLPLEQEGFLPNPLWKQAKIGEPWRIGDTYNVSIGQGDLLVTPIELINYISAIANGGILYQPRIMKDIKDINGNIILSSNPKILADLRTDIKNYLPIVREGMLDSTQKPYGLAYLLHDLPIQVAVKTGTAQIENNQKINAIFTGFAPYNNPQIAVLILIENAKQGSINTLPLAKDIFLWYYQNRLSKNK